MSLCRHDMHTQAPCSFSFSGSRNVRKTTLIFTLQKDNRPYQPGQSAAQITKYDTLAQCDRKISFFPQKIRTELARRKHAVSHLPQSREGVKLLLSIKGG